MTPGGRRSPLIRPATGGEGSEGVTRIECNPLPDSFPNRDQASSSSAPAQADLIARTAATKMIDSPPATDYGSTINNKWTRRIEARVPWSLLSPGNDITQTEMELS